MNEINYIGANELIFNKENGGDIHSGGFGVESILMRAGMSPIISINDAQLGGNLTTNKVSELFDNGIAVPNWALSYNNRIGGSKYVEVEHSDSDDDVVDDDLHDKLLELVKEHNIRAKEMQPETTHKTTENKTTEIKTTEIKTNENKKKMTRRGKHHNSSKRKTKKRKLV